VQDHRPRLGEWQSCCLLVCVGLGLWWGGGARTGRGSKVHCVCLPLGVARHARLHVAGLLLVWCSSSCLRQCTWRQGISQRTILASAVPLELCAGAGRVCVHTSHMAAASRRFLLFANIPGCHRCRQLQGVQPLLLWCSVVPDGVAVHRPPGDLTGNHANSSCAPGALSGSGCVRAYTEEMA
jgi:hypothetical protein